MTDLTAQIEKALLPCPFCGNDGSGPIEDALQICEVDMEGTWKAPTAYFAQCDKCTGTMGYSETPEGAVDAWNTRAPDLAMAKRLERAEAVARRFATALSMIEDEISSAETYNPAISAIVRGELDWADEQYVSAAFRGEDG